MGQQKKIRKCGVPWFGFLLPFREKLRLIKDAGFDTVCTWWDDMFLEMDGRKNSSIRRFPRDFLSNIPICRILDMMNCGGGLSRGCLVCPVLRAVAGAAASGIRTVVMHPFERQAPPAGDWAVFIARMERIAGESARRGNPPCDRKHL